MIEHRQMVFTGLRMARQEMISHRGKLFSNRRTFMDRRIKIIEELLTDMEIFYGPESTNPPEPGI
jgi:hypothetical protein